MTTSLTQDEKKPVVIYHANLESANRTENVVGTLNIEGNFTIRSSSSSRKAKRQMKIDGGHSCRSWLLGT